jgi:hypothetical protein
VALVTYKLKGERIKAALVKNPGAIIITPRQAGKTTQLCEYVQERHPSGVVLYCHSEDEVFRIRDHHLSERFFKESILLWGQHQLPFTRGSDKPIYGDEVLMLGGTMVKQMVRDPRFMGAVATAPSMKYDDEVMNRCILY